MKTRLAAIIIAILVSACSVPHLQFEDLLAGYRRNEGIYYSSRMDGEERSLINQHDTLFYRLDLRNRAKYLAYAFSTYAPGNFDGEIAFTFRRFLTCPSGEWNCASARASYPDYTNDLLRELSSLDRAAIAEMAKREGGSIDRFDENLVWWTQYLKND